LVPMHGSAITYVTARASSEEFYDPD
jgi:hypothetical protein